MKKEITIFLILLSLCGLIAWKYREEPLRSKRLTSVYELTVNGVRLGMSEEQVNNLGLTTDVGTHVTFNEGKVTAIIGKSLEFDGVVFKNGESMDSLTRVFPKMISPESGNHDSDWNLVRLKDGDMNFTSSDGCMVNVCVTNKRMTPHNIPTSFD